MRNECELYHYGVKGMKWRVRRYQNADGSLTEAGKKKVDTYRKKEGAKIAKRRLREIKVDNRVVGRATAYYEKTLAKKGQSPKTQKAANNYIRTKAVAIARDEIAKAEVRKVLSMNLSDITHEQKMLGRRAAARALTNIGSMSIMLLGSPVGVFRYTTSERTARYKTNIRVPREQREQIRLQAMKEAAAEILHT